MGRALDQIAESLQDRFAEVSRKESEAKSGLLDAQHEKFKVQASIDCLNLLRSGVTQLATDDCIQCFVLHGRDSKMTAIPSDSDVDNFRCRICGYETEIE